MAAYEAALEAGIDHELFWRLTPWATKKAIEAYVRSRKKDHDVAISNAWHAAAFSGQRKLKPLAEYLKDGGGVKAPKRRQTPMELFAAVRSFARSG